MSLYRPSTTAADPDAGPPPMPRKGGQPVMTLRDKFAGQALMGLVAFDRPSTSGLSDNRPEHFARWAYALSDAMLAERSKP